MSSDLRNLDIDWKGVGRRVRELRGYYCKQSELADVIGVAQSNISAIERGQKEAGTVILLRLARHFRKSLDWLVCGDEPDLKS